MDQLPPDQLPPPRYYPQDPNAYKQDFSRDPPVFPITENLHELPSLGLVIPPGIPQATYINERGMENLAVVSNTTSRCLKNCVGDIFRTLCFFPAISGTCCMAATFGVYGGGASSALCVCFEPDKSQKAKYQEVSIIAKAMGVAFADTFQCQCLTPFVGSNREEWNALCGDLMLCPFGTTAIPTWFTCEVLGRTLHCLTCNSCTRI